MGHLDLTVIILNKQTNQNYDCLRVCMKDCYIASVNHYAFN